MKTVRFIAALAIVVLATGCGSQQARVKVPEVQAVDASKKEAQWLRRLHLTPASALATSVSASAIGVSIQKAARQPGVEILRLKIYSAKAPATALVLAVKRPAYFLRHQLRSFLHLRQNPFEFSSRRTPLRDPFYLRVVDTRGRFVFERYEGVKRGNYQGELYYGIRGDLTGCVYTVLLGPGKIPPCPVQPVLPSIEQTWFKRLGLTRYSPSDPTLSARRTKQSIADAAHQSGVEIVRLTIYTHRFPATLLELRVTRPAYFLRYGFERVRNRLDTPFYLRVVDEKNKRVLEQSLTGSGNGDLSGRFDVLSCAGIVTHGPGGQPPCPIK